MLSFTKPFQTKDACPSILRNFYISQKFSFIFSAFSSKWRHFESILQVCLSFFLLCPFSSMFCNSFWHIFKRVLLLTKFFLVVPFPCKVNHFIYFKRRHYIFYYLDFYNNARVGRPWEFLVLACVCIWGEGMGWFREPLWAHNKEWDFAVCWCT